MCNAVSSEVCTSCGMIAYCSPLHQQVSQGAHAQVCHGFKEAQHRKDFAVLSRALCSHLRSSTQTLQTTFHSTLLGQAVAADQLALKQSSYTLNIVLGQFNWLELKLHDDRKAARFSDGVVSRATRIFARWKAREQQVGVWLSQTPNGIPHRCVVVSLSMGISLFEAQELEQIVNAATLLDKLTFLRESLMEYRSLVCAHLMEIYRMAVDGNSKDFFAVFRAWFDRDLSPSYRKYPSWVIDKILGVFDKCEVSDSGVHGDGIVSAVDMRAGTVLVDFCSGNYSSQRQKPTQPRATHLHHNHRSA